MAGLTPKQEAFALAFFETGNAAEAYRRAYDVADGARDPWIRVEACQLLDNPNIALFIEEMREHARKHSIYTRQQAMDELEEARKAALIGGMPAAAVSATNTKIKLWGLEAPKKIAATHSNPDGSPLAPALDVSKLSASTLRELMDAKPDEEPDA